MVGGGRVIIPPPQLSTSVLLAFAPVSFLRTARLKGPAAGQVSPLTSKCWEGRGLGRDGGGGGDACQWPPACRPAQHVTAAKPARRQATKPPDSLKAVARVESQNVTDDFRSVQFSSAEDGICVSDGESR